MLYYVFMICVVQIVLRSAVPYSILYNDTYPYEISTKRIYGPLMSAAVTTGKSVEAACVMRTRKNPLPPRYPHLAK